MIDLKRLSLIFAGLALLAPAAGILITLLVLGSCVSLGPAGFGMDRATFAGLAATGLLGAGILTWGGVALIRKADRLGREEPPP